MIEKIMVDYVNPDISEEPYVALVNIIYSDGTIYHPTTLIELLQYALKAEGFELLVTDEGASVVKCLSNKGRYEVYKLHDGQVNMIKKSVDLRGLQRRQFEEYLKEVKSIVFIANENNAKIALFSVEYDIHKMSYKEMSLARAEYDLSRYELSRTQIQDKGGKN